MANLYDVLIVDEKPFGTSLKVKVQFIDTTNRSITFDREYTLPFRSGITVAAAKALLLEKMIEFESERDIDARFIAFKGSTFTKTQLGG